MGAAACSRVVAHPMCDATSACSASCAAARLRPHRRAGTASCKQATPLLRCSTRRFRQARPTSRPSTGSKHALQIERVLFDFLDLFQCLSCRLANRLLVILGGVQQRFARFIAADMAEQAIRKAAEKALEE